MKHLAATIAFLLLTLGEAVAGGDGLGAGPYSMTRDAEGVWSVTTPPAVPGFHYYWFVLDGVVVSDPASDSVFGYGKQTSGIEVPEAGAGWTRQETLRSSASRPPSARSRA